MSIIAFLLLLTAHIASGYGLIHLFRIRLKPLMQIGLSAVCGVVLLSFIPFFLELAHIPLTAVSVFSGIAVMTAALLLPAAMRGAFRKSAFNPTGEKIFSIRLYEWPFMLLLLLCTISSVWRTFYYPPNARDILSGPEAIAEYAVKEHTLINSVLSINLETTNNHLKPPYITDLQIIYKLAGFPFGQGWLSVVFIGFVIFLYGMLRERVHRLLACALLLLFFAIPEMFSYTFIILFDYSNMVLFFLGFYFLYRYFVSSDSREFYFSVVLFGFATWVRSETLVLVAMTIPALWLYAWRHKAGIIKTGIQTAVLMAVSYFFYAIWISVFLKHYMPGGFNLNGQINKDFTNVGIFFTRLTEMNTKVIFGDLSDALWAHYFTIFLVFFIAELVVRRKLSRESRNWLYGALVVYFGLPLLGYLIPLVDLMNTTKRGLFKIMPFLLMLLANNGLLVQLSAAITKWEEEPAGEKKNIAAKPIVIKPAPQARKK